MTVRIFKDSGENIETIINVIHVLSHSVQTSNTGLDLEIHMYNEDNISFETKEIHLDKWDFWSIDN